MLIESGKSVQNSVQKYEQKTWKEIVQKNQTVESFKQKNSFPQKDVAFKQVFQKFIHQFRTNTLISFSLLSESFTLFTHRTINTTITFNNKEIINF